MKEVKSEEVTSDLYDGKIAKQVLIEPRLISVFQANLVTFNPRAKNVFHSHSNDQVLLVTDGKGIVATKKEEPPSRRLRRSSFMPMNFIVTVQSQIHHSLTFHFIVPGLKTIFCKVRACWPVSV